MILNSSNKFSLSQIADFIGGDVVNSSQELLLSAVCDSDKDKIEHGIFIAIKGSSFDGHNLIESAKSNGCLAAVVENKEYLKGLPGVVVTDTRKAKAFLASLFTGMPEKKLDIIGVTGTNGKSSTCWMTSSLLNQLGSPCLSIGTLGASGPGINQELGLTTPDSFVLHKLLKEALAAGISSVVMESSAHALTQFRIEALSHKAALFSNLSHDHLDYYQTKENYFQAKVHLFDLLSEDGTALINLDDRYGSELLAGLAEKKYLKKSIGRSDKADFWIKKINQEAAATEITLAVLGREYSFSAPFIAVHNVYNLVSSIALANSLGYEINQIVSAVAKIPQIPGRLELVTQAPNVFVDYAHTPDALEKVLSALKEICQGELWVVFGCGGDRDAAKRPVMGEIASKFADKVIVTSDNPRSEEPQVIVDQIIVGISGEYRVEVDRGAAIELAVTTAKAEDVVLIAGKGHEDYQIIGTRKIDFSDAEHVRNSAKFKQRN
ncbi:MAG: UDP-N-acetylmuramoyl-L-alanyl-D-glutamate--2,6-diaminopimelate ligase [Bdellovibrionota bacterium]